jgi:hypothetical protein
MTVFFKFLGNSRGFKYEYRDGAAFRFTSISFFTIFSLISSTFSFGIKKWRIFSNFSA